jgi:protein involved in polysaccharide export with SLBB domain
MTKVTNRSLRISMLLFGATCASAGQNSGRILVNSDVVAIRIVDHPELDTTTRVEPDGTINFPYVGRIRAAGRSEDDLARAVGRRLVELKILTNQ